MTSFTSIFGSIVTPKTRAELAGHPAFAHLRTDGDGNPCVWENHYTDGYHHWSFAWSCQCDDDGIEPHTSDWLPTCAEWNEDGSPGDDAYRLWQSLPEKGDKAGEDAYAAMLASKEFAAQDDAMLDEMAAHLARRENATILAALRFWQREAVGVMDEFPEDDIASDNGTLVPLTRAEIDRLCEQINLNVDADPSF